MYIYIVIYIYPYRSKCLLRKYWRYDSGGSAVPSQTVFGSQKRLYYAILVYLFILQDPIPAVLSPQDPVPALATSCPCRGNIRLIVQRRPGILASDVKMFFCKYNDPIYAARMRMLLSLSGDHGDPLKKAMGFNGGVGYMIPR